MQAAAGVVIGGRYALTSRIAGGGMGEVWRADDRVLERAVAVKLLRADLTDDPQFLARFRIEARNAAKLSHGNIAQVHDYGEDNGTAYLVLELVEGIPLSRLIAESAPLPEPDAVHLLVQAATALHAAHTKGIVHRDVKPANVVVDDESTAKLTDFGIARALDAASFTRVGEVMGTPQYIAPEAAIGKEATPESDIYSLAVVGYELLVGRLPYSADTAIGYAMAHVTQPVPTLPDHVSPALRVAIMSALAKDPAERPQGATAFAHQLQQAINDQTASHSAALSRVRVAHLPTGGSETDTGKQVQTLSAPAPQPSRSLLPGHNAVLSGERITIQVESADGAALDLVACELDEHDRALGEEAFVFYNQPTSGDGSVHLTGAGRVMIDTSAVGAAVHSISIGIAVEPPATLGAVAGLRTRILSEGSVTREMFDATADLGDERAAMLVTVYRRGSGWKVRNVCAGWRAGLSALVESVGLTAP